MGDKARSAGDASPAGSQAALLEDARSAGDASPASQAALLDSQLELSIGCPYDVDSAWC